MGRDFDDVTITNPRKYKSVSLIFSCTYRQTKNKPLTYNICKTQKRGSSSPIVNPWNTQQHGLEINSRTLLVLWIFVAKVVPCRSIRVAYVGHCNHNGLSIRKEGHNKDKEKCCRNIAFLQKLIVERGLPPIRLDFVRCQILTIAARPRLLVQHGELCRDSEVYRFFARVAKCF